MAVSHSRPEKPGNLELSARVESLQQLLEQAGLDAKAQVVAAQIQDVLMTEIHHRMKNMLAMVTAIVRQSLRSTVNIADAEAAICARLMAMAKAHDFLLAAGEKSASLTGVVRAAIEQHDTSLSRIIVRGDDIDIIPSSILPLSLALNELCTNATKYGALSIEAGSVTVGWVLDEADKSVRFKWIESGGPAVHAPRTKSLGTRLIEEALPRQLGGQARLVFHGTGVEFQLVVPQDRLTNTKRPTESRAF
jgi:two-component sensor histidine kinase